MEFNKSYNRQEFMQFLQNNFLPEDFKPTNEAVTFSTQMKYSTEAMKLGSSESLDLVVYEIKHTSCHDARVALSKEAFRMLADEMEDRALVVFVPEDDCDNYRFSFIEISLDINEETNRISRNYSNPRRYSYLLGKGIAYYTPNKYLNMKGRVVSDEDLHDRFSVEVLTKEFYNELSDWYAWAIQIIRFPNDINNDTDNSKYNNEGAIRLITRLIFVWFLKQRHLIPEEFFNETFVAQSLLKDFNPHKTEGFFQHKLKNTKYYPAILQNLFFAMLNSPITAEGSNELSERHFRNGRGDFDNNKLMRYEDYFSNPQLFVDLANKTVPFLNGGLFDCLDDKDNGMYYDGFSDTEKSRKDLVVPDFLFFGEEVGKNIDLSEWYGNKNKKKVSARGIIDILKRYNFTVEENTPFDKEVSLDPELLGKVFENLLASFNPETQTTARKQTGSFYTPREIVQYMVDESLIAHLKRTVSEDLEPQFRQLLQYTDEPIDFTDEQRKAIMQSLYDCKILDPACGSGAFPMGILQQMVHILGRIDPDNVQWKEMMMNQAINETTEAFKSTTKEERQELIADIERNFDEGVNRPDYARKLYLIENCIYGVDIQPIAIQISKLRFFISLVVDQNTNMDPIDNFGIRPLPNLEAKFVAANTLIGLNSDLSLADQADSVRNLKQQLKTAKHKIFSAKTVRTKRKYKQQVNELRIAIANELESLGFINGTETYQLASWDMFDQNASSPFFDPDWMFGVKVGFDIVIGNPPYIDAKDQLKKEELNRQRLYLSKDKRFATLYQKWDLYIAFIEIGIKYFCNQNGLCTMIVPYPLSNQLYSQKMRGMIVNEFDLIEVVDLNGVKVFENATVTNCIPFVRKSHIVNTTIISKADKSKRIEHAFCQPFSNLIQDKKTLVWNFTQENRNSNKHEGMHVLGDYCYISKGMVLNADEKKAKGEFKKADLITDYADDIHCKPYIEGKDLERYRVKRHRYLEWNTKRCPGELSRPTFPELYTSEKLLINALGEMKASIDLGENYYCEQQVRMALLWKDLSIVNNKSIESSIKKFSTMKRTNMEKLSRTVNLRFLLGIVNSKYASVLLSSIRGGDYHIVPEHIRNIPIPDSIAEQQAPIILLVESILASKCENPSADTSSDEQEIDRLVYHLYGLTYEEVKVVDPETPITEEEYNKE